MLYNSEVQRRGPFDDDSVAAAEAAAVTNTWLLTKRSLFFRGAGLASMFLMVQLLNSKIKLQGFYQFVNPLQG